MSTQTEIKSNASAATTAQISHHEAIVRALRVLDMLENYIACGAEKIYFSALMPDDGHDGTNDEETFEDAVRSALTARKSLCVI